MYGESGDFSPPYNTVCRRGAHVGAGSHDRKGVGRREKERDRRGLVPTYGVMYWSSAEDMALLDIILVQHAFLRSSELQCTYIVFKIIQYIPSNIAA